MDASNNRPDVFLMSWDQSSRTVQTTSFPDLPAPMAFMGAVLLDGYVYIAGGTAGQDKGHTTNSFYRLNLQGGERQSVGSQRIDTEWEWEKLPSWNGPGRMMPVLAEKNNGTYKGVFLFSGRKGAAEGERSEEHTSELQSLMRKSYAVFCLKKKKKRNSKQKHELRNTKHIVTGSRVTNIYKTKYPSAS